MMKMAKKRTSPRQPVVSIYLGDREKRLERLARLDEVAARFSVNRSVLIQKIADGELIVVKADQTTGDAKRQ
jgi:hypothetical protein